MGRKARNKQGPPAPLSEYKLNKISKGKRKAEDDDEKSKKVKTNVKDQIPRKANPSTSLQRQKVPLKSSLSKSKAPKVLVNGDAKRLREAERK